MPTGLAPYDTARFFVEPLLGRAEPLGAISPDARDHLALEFEVLCLI